MATKNREAAQLKKKINFNDEENQNLLKHT